MNLDVELNEQQKDITKAVEGVYVVIAGPGSGKTKTLLERHIRMLMAGIQQKDILNLTFTSAAAAEMVRRSGILKASIGLSRGNRRRDGKTQTFVFAAPG